MNHVRPRLIAPLILFLLTIGVFWKILLTRQYTFLDSPDDAYQVAPWLQAQAAALHRGEILLWGPYFAGGQSLIGQMQPGTANPLNWLLFLVPLRNGFIKDGALNWYFALIHFFAALACYALCRDLGRSRTASILGGAAYAFSGYVGTTHWPQMLQATVWAPVALLFSLRAIRGERVAASALLSGFFLGIAWLGGHHQIPVFMILAIGAIWIFHIARAKTPRVGLERSTLLVALLVMMIAAGALQIFPAFSYGHDAVRWVGASHELKWNQTVPYSVHDEYSLQPWSVLGVFINGIFTYSNPFAGVVVFFLAISGIVLAWNDTAIRVLASMAVGGLILAFTNYTLVHGIIYSMVPFVEKARAPAMAVFIFHLGVCTLAAFGLDALPAALESRWIRSAIPAIGILAALLWIFVFVGATTKIQLTARLGAIAMTAFAATLRFWLLVAMKSGRVRAPVLLVVLMMIEIGGLAGGDLQNRDLGWRFWPQVTRDRDVAQFLKSRPGPFRIEVKEDDVPYNFGDWYGIESYFGYMASAPEAFIRLIGEQRTRALLGVEYYLAKAPARAGQREVFSGAGGIKVFETTGALPRLRTIHEVTSITDPNQLGPELNAIDIARAAFLLGETSPALENCSGDVVNIVRSDSQSMTIDAAMACRGMVIVANAYSKDWVATVDGQPAKIYAAYSILSAITVDRGHHRIELRYRPVSVYLGASLTAAAMLFAFLVWLAPGKPRGLPYRQ